MKKIIIYLYNGLEDPLIKGNIMLYILDASKSGKYEFYIITYEQDQFKLTDEQATKKRQELEKLNIHWKAYNWSYGSKIKKGFDFLRAIGFIFSLKLKGYHSIISLATVAGAFSYIYSKLFNLKLYLYQYEPHSEYGRDANMWGEKSLVFKVLKRLEYLSAKKATVISSGTYHMMNRLSEWNVKGTAIKIPSVVDHQRFQFSESERIRIRDQFGINSDQKLIIYPGKFGDLYFDNEVGVLFKALLDISPKYFFLILTLTDQDHAREVLLNNGVPKEKFHVGSSSYADMPGYLSAADLGVVAVPPLPSKKFCSNIKVGEYLCNGLPYLICKGVSEDDEFAINRNVGIVVKYFDSNAAYEVDGQLNTLLKEDKSTLNERCRKAGMDYRSFESLNPRFREALALI